MILEWKNSFEMVIAKSMNMLEIEEDFDLS
jgi:hypothetical protein